MKYTIIKYKTGAVIHENVDEETAVKFLKISAKTIEEKARFGELIRGSWKVIRTDPERDMPTEDALLRKKRDNSRFSETDWNEFKEDWYRACDRIAAACGVTLAWLKEVNGC